MKIIKPARSFALSCPGNYAAGLVLLVAACADSPAEDSDPSQPIRGTSMTEPAAKSVAERKPSAWKQRMEERAREIKALVDDAGAELISFRDLSSFPYDDGTGTHWTDPFAYGGADWNPNAPTQATSKPSANPLEGTTAESASFEELPVDGSGIEQSPADADDESRIQQPPENTVADPTVQPPPTETVDPSRSQQPPADTVVDSSVERPPADRVLNQPVGATLGHATNEDEEDSQIPAEVLALDGRKVAIEGFVMPLDVKDGMMQSFLLTGNLGACCFGGMPAVNEWIEVTTPTGEGFEYIPFGVLLVIGILEVGAEMDENGIVSSLYRMKAHLVVSMDY